MFTNTVSRRYSATLLTTIAFLLLVLASCQSKTPQNQTVNPSETILAIEPSYEPTQQASPTLPPVEVGAIDETQNSNASISTELINPTADASPSVFDPEAQGTQNSESTSDSLSPAVGKNNADPTPGNGADSDSIAPYSDDTDGIDSQQDKLPEPNSYEVGIPNNTGDIRAEYIISALVLLLIVLGIVFKTRSKR